MGSGISRHEDALTDVIWAYGNQIYTCSLGIMQASKKMHCCKCNFLFNSALAACSEKKMKNAAG